jgi:hypothetical protein
VSVRVNHSNDPDGIGPDAIEHRVRETLDEDAPEIAMNRRIRERDISNTSDGITERVAENRAQPWALLLVPAEGLQCFGAGFGE